MTTEKFEIVKIDGTGIFEDSVDCKLGDALVALFEKGKPETKRASIILTPAGYIKIQLY